MNPRPSLCERDALQLSYIPYKLYSVHSIHNAFSWFFGKGLKKKGEIKFGVIGFRTQDLTYAKGTLYYWAASPTFCSVLYCVPQSKLHSLGFLKNVLKKRIKYSLEILGFTTELYPLHSDLRCVRKSKMHSPSFFGKGLEKRMKSKFWDLGIRTQGLPYANGTLYHWATSPSLVIEIVSRWKYHWETAVSVFSLPIFIFSEQQVEATGGGGGGG